MSNNALQRVEVFTLPTINEFGLNQLNSIIRQLELTSLLRIEDDALLLVQEGQKVIFFDFGVAVSWALTPELKTTLTQALPLVTNNQGNVKWEHCHYQINPEKAPSFVNDVLSLANDDNDTLLAASYALAQSVKLAQFADIAESMVTTNNQLTNELSQSGKIALSRKQLAKLRGQLHRNKCDILLRFNLLDTPDFFWEKPTLEPIYILVSGYLELNSRTKLLQLKLSTISELLEMLTDEQNHKHASFLEWIIIVLIAIDIIIYFFE
ncbi:RMD1 family protein [Colwellia sp. MEBiC06753]